MKIAYLASKQSLPGKDSREVDLLEHQQMMSVLDSAFYENDSTLLDLAWDDTTVDWAGFDAVVIGSTWDYCDRYDEFLTSLKAINKLTPVYNTPELVAWNSHKSYLKALERRGVSVIPTIWLDEPKEEVNWNEMFEIFDTVKLVVKRQVGANAEGQFILKKGQETPLLTHPMMVQPFLNTIAKEGEYSLVFIDGQLSHALIKRPKLGDYRIQASYGGTEEAVELDVADIDTARSALSALDSMPLYARVDMLRNPAGGLLLMELELIEPFLYPLQSSNLGNLIYKALEQRLSL